MAQPLDLSASKPAAGTSGDASQIAGGFTKIEQWGNNGGMPLTSLDSGGAAVGQALLWNGTQWVPGTVSGGGGGSGALPLLTALPGAPAVGDQIAFTDSVA